MNASTSTRSVISASWPTSLAGPNKNLTFCLKGPSNLVTLLSSLSLYNVHAPQADTGPQLVPSPSTVRSTILPLDFIYTNKTSNTVQARRMYQHTHTFWSGSTNRSSIRATCPSLLFLTIRILAVTSLSHPPNHTNSIALAFPPFCVFTTPQSISKIAPGQKSYS
jgi:hypothetical protein